MKSIKKLIVMCAAGCLVLLTAACGGGVADAEQQVPTVNVATLHAVSDAAKLQYPGRVKAALEASIAVRPLAQADENLQLSRKQYEAGMESISDLLDAHTLWQQAYATMVESRCAKYLAHVKSLKAAGLLAVSD